jgi:hypothetical protein
MTMDRHEPFEELISASLTGDLTVEERQRLDAHLDVCLTCRATLASFAEQRRIMSGLRHVAPPRDLGARVRYGIEGGAFATTPWWRRPAFLFAGVGGSLAAVAGALLALVLLNGLPQDNPIGQSSGSPGASAAATEIAGATATPASATPVPTAAPTPPAPTLPPPPVPGEPVPTPNPSGEPGPTPSPNTASPEPDVFLAYNGPVDSPALTVVDGSTGETAVEVADAQPGPPVAAELSPDSGFLAVATRLGESGLNEIQVTRLAQTDASASPSPSPSPSPSGTPMDPGETLTLAESVAVDPFVERMTWSPDGRFLAFTVADPEALGETDVWVFDADAEEAWQLTDAGNAYAGSWVRADHEDDPPLLWVSSAAEEPVSHLVTVVDHDEPRERIDPSEDAVAEAEGVFVPILNPSGRFAIYWTGRMAEEPDRGWVLSEGGAPYLSEHKLRGRTWTFDNDRPLFSDLTIDRDAFTSAAITWGADDVTYAVSEVRWTGASQGEGGAEYPDATRVYFGRATDPQGLTQRHAIDIGDIREGSSVIDVKVSPTGRHLVITALRPVGGVGDQPKADLLLVTRNLGDVPDEVEIIGNGDEGWFGPAAFDELIETGEDN